MTKEECSDILNVDYFILCLENRLNRIQKNKKQPQPILDILIFRL
jgi:hypothetical protein